MSGITNIPKHPTKQNCIPHKSLCFRKFPYCQNSFDEKHDFNGFFNNESWRYYLRLTPQPRSGRTRGMSTRVFHPNELHGWRKKHNMASINISNCSTAVINHLGIPSGKQKYIHLFIFYQWHSYQSPACIDFWWFALPSGVRLAVATGNSGSTAVVF